MILNMFQTQSLINPCSGLDFKVFFQWTPSSVYYTYSLKDSMSGYSTLADFLLLSSSIRSMSSDDKSSTASVVKGPSSFCCFNTYLPDKSKDLLGTMQVALKAFWKVPDPNGWAGNPCTSRTQWSGPSVSMEPQSLAIVNDVIATGNSTTCRRKESK